MGAIPFRKMHGLGNDFVVIDARARELPLSPAQARAIADRRLGVGCDQLIVIERPKSGLADAFMRIRNPDGGEAEACGNATRCVARLVMDELGRDHVIVETIAGLLDAEAAPDGLVTVDMGPARFDWREIPLREPCDTLHVPITVGALADPVCTNMGNPHATFFVPDVATVPLADVGPVLERHRMFPERANIGVAEVMSRTRLRLRVWERGAGITLACGSGACAALVAAARRDLTGRRADVVVDGGTLTIEWLADGHAVMTGPVCTAYTGELPETLLRAAEPVLS
ncbi:MAG: diaminopimelate epimerase [Alphaproteobacteria bacterium]|nr:diaminopimelate epimerase [Alphaproteobacteria bacterium]